MLRRIAESDSRVGPVVGRRYIDRINQLYQIEDFREAYNIASLRLHSLRGSRTGQLSIMTTNNPRRFSDLPIPPGENLAEELEARGMTTQELASALGVSEQSVAEIIRGERPITDETASGLEKAIGVRAVLDGPGSQLPGNPGAASRPRSVSRRLNG